MDANAVIAMIGGIALLIGIFGGGVKAKEVEIPLIPPFVRILSGSTGVILLGVTVWLSIRTSTSMSPPTGAAGTATISTVVEIVPSITTSPIQGIPQPTDSPVPIFTNVFPTITPVEIATSGATNWVFALEYRFADRFWSAGERWYSLTWTCADDAPISVKHNFTVSNDFPLRSGDVYLQTSTLHVGDPWGVVVDGINPAQSTVASMFWDNITKSEADSRASNCRGNVVSDSGAYGVLSGKLFRR